MDYYFLDKDGDVGKCRDTDKDFPKDLAFQSSESEVSSSCIESNECKVDEMEEAQNSSNINDLPMEEQEVLGTSDEQIMRIISENHEDTTPDGSDDSRVKKDNQLKENEDSFESAADSILKNVIGAHEQHEPVIENAVNLDGQKIDKRGFYSFFSENSVTATSQESSCCQTINAEGKDLTDIPENLPKNKKLRRNNNFDVHEKKPCNTVTETKSDVLDSEVSNKQITSTESEEIKLGPACLEEKEVVSKESVQDSQKDSEAEYQESKTKSKCEVIPDIKDYHEEVGSGTSADSQEDNRLETPQDSNECVFKNVESSNEENILGNSESRTKDNVLETAESIEEDALGTPECSNEDNVLETSESSNEDGMLVTGENKFENNGMEATEENSSVSEETNETETNEEPSVKEKANELQDSEIVDRLDSSKETCSDFPEQTEIYKKLTEAEAVRLPVTSLNLPDDSNKRDLTEGEEKIVKKNLPDGSNKRDLTEGEEKIVKKNLPDGSNKRDLTEGEEKIVKKNLPDGSNKRDLTEGEEKIVKKNLPDGSNKRDLTEGEEKIVKKLKLIEDKEEETCDRNVANEDIKESECDGKISKNAVNGLKHGKVVSTLPNEEDSDSLKSSDSHAAELFESPSEENLRNEKIQMSKCDEIITEDCLNKIEDERHEASRTEEMVKESSNVASEDKDTEQGGAKNLDSLTFDNTEAESEASIVPEGNQEKTDEAYLDYDEESIENISRTIRSFSNEKLSPKKLENRSTDQKEISPSKRVIVVKTAPNVERVKRKLEEILERSKGEEDAAIAELQRMKREKTDILNAITTEMEKLKSMLVKEKQG